MFHFLASLGLFALSSLAIAQPATNAKKIAVTPVVAAPLTKLLANDKPVRIVTLGGSITETVCELGACNSIVASDDSSLYPASLSAKPRVGYFRAISAEGILSLAPSLVIATDQAGPPSALAQIKAAGVRVVSIPDEKTVEGAKSRMTTIAALLGAEAAGQDHIARIDTKLASLTQKTAKLTTKPKVLFVYARGARHLQVAGNHTAASEMVKIAGGEPAVTGFEGYKPMTAESVVAANPDIILLTSSGGDSIGDAEAILELPGVALTAAGRHKKIALMDDLLLLGFGPRVGDAALELYEKLHP